MEAPTSGRASRRASLPSFGGTAPARPLSLPEAEACSRSGPGVGNPVAPTGSTGRTRSDLPRSWESPHASLPCSRTPAGPLHQAVTVQRRGPRISVRRGLPTRGNFGAQSQGRKARCLRFVRPVARRDARLASGRWPSATGREWIPAGLQQRFRISSPPYPSFVAQTLSPYPALSLSGLHAAQRGHWASSWHSQAVNAQPLERVKLG
jgi:hypothetical protein